MTRNPYLHDYLADTLTILQKKQFEDHLFFCLKCQEDLEYMRWAVQQLITHATHSQTTDEVFQQAFNQPLRISSILDGNAQNFIHDYHEKPLMDQLAASTKTSGELAFPITLEYEEGRVIGQFRKRAGQLFYKLQKGIAEQQESVCILMYASRSTPSDVRIFAIKEGEDRCIGDFAEIVQSNTIQGMLDAIKQFQVLLRPER